MKLYIDHLNKQQKTRINDKKNSHQVNDFISNAITNRIHFYFI